MNDTIKTIMNRHSTRVYLDKEISKDDKDVIFKSIIESPSAGNMQTFSVIEVQDKDKLDKLAISCDNQPFIKDGKMVLLFVTNPLRYYEVYNQCHEEKLYPTIADFYLNINDALIAAQTSVLAAESLGIGSCYIGDVIENYEQIKKMFNLPKYVNPVCLLVFGYKKNTGVSPKRFNREDLIMVDEFKNDSLGAFINKIDKDNQQDAKQRAYDMISRLFERKMKAPFFKEMNRSFSLMLDEFMEEK